MAEASDEEKCVILNKLSTLFWNIAEKPDKIVFFAKKALNESRRVGNREQEVFALVNLAHGNRRVNNYPDALSCGAQALEMAEKNNHKGGILRALTALVDINHSIPNIPKAIGYTVRMKSIYLEMGDEDKVARMLVQLGALFFTQGEVHKSQKYLQDALHLYKKVKNDEMIALTQINIGKINLRYGKIDVATKLFFDNLKFCEQKGLTRMLAIVCESLGLLYEDLKRYDKALEFYERSLKIFEDMDNSAYVGVIKTKIGSLYRKKKKYKESLKYLKEALELKYRIDSTGRHGASIILAYIGNVYFDMKIYPKALGNYVDALTLSIKFGEKEIMLDCYSYIGNTHMMMDDFKKSEKYFLLASTSIKDQEDLDFKLANLKSLSNLYEKFGKYKEALKYFHLYHELVNQRYNSDTSKQFAEMETKYETEKKEKEIEVLTQDNQIQELVLERQKMVRYAIILFALVLLLLLVIFFRKYRHLLIFWKKKNMVGHYKLMDKIASGGMGVVYKAHDLLDKSQEIAIKVLREEYFADEDQRKRFKNEASIIGQFDHPNIVKVVERGEADGNLYIAMEFLDGPTLAQIIKDEGKFSIPIALDIMLQAADALEKIHSKNIIHRDMKPENIMIVERKGNSNFVKLLDFGLSKTQSFTRLTKTGMILGSIYYLSPEQVLDRELTPAGDIYSLGIIYYEMLAGQKPFAGETEENVILKILEEDPPELITIRHDVPAPLSDLIKSMVAKQPEQRPQLFQVIHTLKQLNRD